MTSLHGQSVYQDYLVGRFLIGQFLYQSVSKFFLKNKIYKIHLSSLSKSLKKKKETLIVKFSLVLVKNWKLPLYLNPYLWCFMQVWIKKRLRKRTIFPNGRVLLLSHSEDLQNYFTSIVTWRYLKQFTSIQALFLAHGPAFRQEVEVKPFENIELYNLMSG